MSLLAPRGQVGLDVAVAVRDLTKTYRRPGGGTIKAVDGVSFDVACGEVFGFLGPNGAGKTTTLEIVEGLTKPTSGHASVLGLDVERDRDRLKQRIGVQLQAGAYFDFLTLEEILDLFGSFYPRRLTPAELLDKVQLTDKRRALVRELSGGQAQRFSIVAALVNDPDVVFLDEPTTGLDPQARRHLWELVTAVNRDEGKTVILTTHYMEEAELLCDRVAIIDHGRIVALDTPLGLVRQLPDPYRVVFTVAPPTAAEDAAGLPGMGHVVRDPRSGTVEIRVAEVEQVLKSLLEWAEARGVAVTDLRVLPRTLEDVFLALTGRDLRE